MPSPPPPLDSHLLNSPVHALIISSFFRPGEAGIKAAAAVGRVFYTAEAALSVRNNFHPSFVWTRGPRCRAREEESIVQLFMPSSSGADISLFLGPTRLLGETGMSSSRSGSCGEEEADELWHAKALLPSYMSSPVSSPTFTPCRFARRMKPETSSRRGITRLWPSRMYDYILHKASAK